MSEIDSKIEEDIGGEQKENEDSPASESMIKASGVDTNSTSSSLSSSSSVEKDATHDIMNCKSEQSGEEAIAIKQDSEGKDDRKDDDKSIDIVEKEGISTSAEKMANDGASSSPMLTSSIESNPNEGDDGTVHCARTTSDDMTASQVEVGNEAPAFPSSKDEGGASNSEGNRVDDTDSAKSDVIALPLGTENINEDDIVHERSIDSSTTQAEVIVIESSSNSSVESSDTVVRPVFGPLARPALPPPHRWASFSPYIEDQVVVTQGPDILAKNIKNSIQIQSQKKQQKEESNEDSVPDEKTGEDTPTDSQTSVAVDELIALADTPSNCAAMPSPDATKVESKNDSKASASSATVPDETTLAAAKEWHDSIIKRVTRLQGLSTWLGERNKRMDGMVEILVRSLEHMGVGAVTDHVGNLIPLQNFRLSSAIKLSSDNTWMTQDDLLSNDINAWLPQAQPDDKNTPLTVEQMRKLESQLDVLRKENESLQRSLRTALDNKGTLGSHVGQWQACIDSAGQQLCQLNKDVHGSKSREKHLRRLLGEERRTKDSLLQQNIALKFEAPQSSASENVNTWQQQQNQGQPHQYQNQQHPQSVAASPMVASPVVNSQGMSETQPLDGQDPQVVEEATGGSDELGSDNCSRQSPNGTIYLDAWKSERDPRIATPLPEMIKRRFRHHSPPYVWERKPWGSRGRNGPPSPSKAVYGDNPFGYGNRPPPVSRRSRKQHSSNAGFNRILDGFFDNLNRIEDALRQQGINVPGPGSPVASPPVAAAAAVVPQLPQTEDELMQAQQIQMQQQQLEHLKLLEQQQLHEQQFHRQQQIEGQQMKQQPEQQSGVQIGQFPVEQSEDLIFFSPPVQPVAIPQSPNQAVPSLVHSPVQLPQQNIHGQVQDQLLIDPNSFQNPTAVLSPVPAQAQNQSPQISFAQAGEQAAVY